MTCEIGNIPGALGIHQHDRENIPASRRHDCIDQWAGLWHTQLNDAFCVVVNAECVEPSSFFVIFGFSCVFPSNLYGSFLIHEYRNLIKVYGTIVLWI